MQTGEYRFRWFPSPTLTVVLALLWLLLNNSAHPGHIVLGTIFGIVIPWLTAPLSAPRPAVRKPGLALRYFLVLLKDIIICNVQVAKQVCGPLKALSPALVAVPLDLQDDLPITILASTISLTPGTVSADVSEDKQWLYVHVLHLESEEQTISDIKTRYEQPLKEIFGC